MKKDRLKSLELEILNCKKQLKELSQEIELDDDKALEYNKIIVQKAILLDEYKKICYKPPLKQRIKDKVLNSFKKKEKLICDYF